eukprot:IDg21497t1
MEVARAICEALQMTHELVLTVNWKQSTRSSVHRKHAAMSDKTSYRRVSATVTGATCRRKILAQQASALTVRCNGFGPSTIETGTKLKRHSEVSTPTPFRSLFECIAGCQPPSQPPSQPLSQPPNQPPSTRCRSRSEHTLTAMADSRNDVENPKASTHAEQERNTREFREAALLLAMWSILVMNEGAVRFIQHGRPSGVGLFKLVKGQPVRFWAPFLGGLFEVTFGLFGLMVGLAGGVLGYFSRPLTLILETSHEIPIGPGGSRSGRLRYLHVRFMGVLALQGGQFVFISRVMAFGGPRDFLNQRAGARMRAIFWNANYAMSGVWATATAAVVIATNGIGITGRYFGPPNVGRIPLYLLFTGLLMIVWPLVGIFISITNKVSVVRKYAAASFVVFAFVWVHYTIGQLGFLAVEEKQSNGPAAGAALHNHLTMMVAFLGPYFMLKQAQEQEHDHPSL